jgi:hypothetical protein
MRSERSPAVLRGAPRPSKNTGNTGAQPPSGMTRQISWTTTGLCTPRLNPAINVPAGVSRSRYPSTTSMAAPLRAAYVPPCPTRKPKLASVDTGKWY